MSTSPEISINDSFIVAIRPQPVPVTCLNLNVNSACWKTLKHLPRIPIILHSIIRTWFYNRAFATAFVKDATYNDVLSRESE